VRTSKRLAAFRLGGVRFSLVLLPLAFLFLAALSEDVSELIQ
jgi:hypothetical protein